MLGGLQWAGSARRSETEIERDQYGRAQGGGVPRASEGRRAKQRRGALRGHGARLRVETTKAWPLEQSAHRQALRLPNDVVAHYQ